MRLLLTICALFFSTSAFAACPQFFPGNKEPNVANTVVLCNSFFGSIYNPSERKVLLSSEVYVQDVDVPRKDQFHSDSRVSNSPTPSDYSNSGYDRGHMVPAADSSTPAEMYDTFLMTNMTPQHPKINRVVWKNLEEAARKMPYSKIVTGAIYGDSIKLVSGIPIPTRLYKVVYLKTGKATVFIVENKPTGKLKTVTLPYLEKLVGIKLH